VDEGRPTSGPGPAEPPESLRRYEAARLRIARLRVRGGGSLGSVLHQAAQHGATALGVDRVGIWLLIDERQAIRLYHLYQPSRRATFEGTVLRAQDFPPYFGALADRRIIAADDARNDPVTACLREAYLEPLGITSMLDATILRDGVVAGVVCHEHTGPPRRWTTEERDFAISVADMVALRFEEAARQDAEASVQLLRESLLEARGAEALGRLATGVAHKFKNALALVLGNAELMADHPAAPPEIVARARRIIEAIGSSQALAQELLEYGRETQHAPRVIDVADVVERWAAMLVAGLGPEWPFRITRAPAVGRVLMDPVQLERILVTLVLNARDAMPGGGTIGIDVREVEITDPDGSPSVFVVLEARDTGRGMDADTQARMFDAFFTTKPPGSATGLGLAIVRQTVDRCGGFIHVATAPGDGTAVRVYLPRIASGA
jgi:signal transduction histidine kinase